MPLLTHDNETLARDYDEISAGRQFKSGQRLVKELALWPGERVLDIGCGTGLLAQYIAELVGPTGRVLGIDPLSLRIELAQSRSRAGLSFEVGDAYALDGFPDGAFDAVCLNAVLHWLPEKVTPLRQIARILVSCGRLAISTGLKGYRNALYDAAAAVLTRPPFSDFPRTEAHLDHRLDENELRSLLEATGFTVALLETRLTANVFPTPDAVLRYAAASSFGNFLAHLPDALQEAARDDIKRALAAAATSEGIPVGACRIVAVATKP